MNSDTLDRMSDSAPLGLPPSLRGPGFSPPPAGPAPWPPAPPVAFRRPSRWPTISAFVIALLALAIGAAGWFRPVQHYRPPAPSTPTYTEQQIADAKTNVCNGYRIAKDEVAANTNQPLPEGDQAGALAVSTNGRLAVLAAAVSLTNRLQMYPATPSDLADKVRALANSYEDFAIRALNGDQNPGLNPIRDQVDAYIVEIDQMCK